MTYTKKVAFNTASQMIGKAIVTAIALTSIGILTRYLGVSGYGEYTTVFAYVAFLAVVADFGFFWILMRQAGALEDQAELNRLASNLLTLRTCLAVLIYFLGFGLGWLLSYPLTVKIGIGIVATAFLLQSINSTLVGIFQINFRIDKAVLAEIIGKLIILAGVIAARALGLSILVIFAVYILGGGANLALNAFWARAYVKIRPAFEMTLWKKIFADAWPMGVLAILGLIYFKIDTIMLSLFKGASSADVGIYGAAYKIVEVLSALPLMFLAPTFPVIVKYLKAQDQQKLQNALQKAFDFLLILAVPVVIGVIMTAPKIIGVIGGGKFVEATTISVGKYPITASTALQILVVAVGVTFFANLFGDLIVALGKQKYLILPNLFFASLNVGLNALVIPRWSYLGTSITTVITETTVLVFTAFIFWRFLDLKPKLTLFPRIILAGLVMAGILYLLQPLNILILIVVGGLVYFALLFSLRVINRQTIKEVIGF